MEKSMPMAIVAMVLSVVAVLSGIAGVLVSPALVIGAGDVGTDQIANNSVTGDKIADGTITDDDISAAGVSRIAGDAVGSDQISDNSITLSDLASAVVDAMTGLENIADNSITSAKIADGTIVDTDVSAGAAIDPSKISGTAWTSTNDGSGSGLDADTVDGLQGSQLLRNDTSGTISGNLTVSGGITHQTEIRYHNVPFCAFDGGDQTTPYSYNLGALTNSDGAFASHYYYAPVNLPHGATITKFAVRYYRPDAASSFNVYLNRRPPLETLTTLFPPVNADFGIYEGSITTNNVVNNENYTYFIYVYIDTNDSQWDVQLTWARITYTITQPLS